MITLQAKNTKFSVDDEGFLSKAEVWNEEIAEIIAEHEGVAQLAGDKMEIIHSMRQYYEKHHNFPILGNICKKVGDRSKDCIAREFSDPMKAWKIAGLPKPPNIFFTSHDGEKYIANPFY